MRQECSVDFKDPSELLSGFDPAAWESRIHVLEAAVEEAKDSGISVQKVGREAVAVGLGKLWMFACACMICASTWIRGSACRRWERLWW